jgi:ssDNA-binding Zn-finger/Zn-ribbon topoisomerase 1
MVCKKKVKSKVKRYINKIIFILCYNNAVCYFIKMYNSYFNKIYLQGQEPVLESLITLDLVGFQEPVLWNSKFAN